MRTPTKSFQNCCFRKWPSLCLDFHYSRKRIFLEWILPKMLVGRVFWRSPISAKYEHSCWYCAAEPGVETAESLFQCRTREGISVEIQDRGPKPEVVATAPCFVSFQVLALCGFRGSTGRCKPVSDATLACHLPGKSLCSSGLASIKASN